MPVELEFSPKANNNLDTIFPHFMFHKNMWKIFKVKMFMLRRAACTLKKVAPVNRGQSLSKIFSFCESKAEIIFQDERTTCEESFQTKICFSSFNEYIFDICNLLYIKSVTSLLSFRISLIF